MSSINFRLYGDQIYGLAISKIKDFISPLIEKEKFNEMYKEGQVKYEFIYSKKKISVHPQITINNLSIQKLFLNIPNETENFNMNLSGLKTTVELFDISENEIEKLIIEKRKTLVEKFIEYAVKKIESKESSKSFIEGLIENLINRAINGLKIELNKIELRIKYKYNIFVILIDNASYSDEKGLHLKNIEIFDENEEIMKKKYHILNKFNIEAEIKKAEDESGNNQLNVKMNNFQFTLSKPIIKAFNEIFNLIDNTKYKYLYVRNKKLIQYYKPKKVNLKEKKEEQEKESENNDNRDNINIVEEKNKYYNLLWLYSIKTVIKLQKYVGKDKLYLLELPNFIQEKISKKYVDNNNEIKNIILPTELNLLKSTKETVEKKVLEGKKGNVLSNAFSFFFGGKKDDEEEKKELSEEEQEIFDNIYTDEYLIQYLAGKKKEGKGESNPIKDKIIEFISKLKININFKKFELILANDYVNKCTLYLSNIKLNVEKQNEYINSVLTVGNIGSNLDENLFSERIPINDNNDLIMVSRDKDNKIKFDLGFKNIDLSEELFNFFFMFCTSIKIHKKNKIFKNIKNEIKNDEEKKEEINNKEKKENEGKIEELNFSSSNVNFKNISISNIPSLAVSNEENKISFSLLSFQITSTKIEITCNIKDSFGTILDNYTFILSKDEKINKYSLNLEAPLKLVLPPESSKLVFISFLKMKERIYQIKKKIENEKKIRNNEIIHEKDNDKENEKKNQTEKEKELYEFNYKKEIDIKKFNISDVHISISIEKIKIEIYENSVKSKLSIHNFDLNYENKDLTLKIGKLSISTNLMSTMIMYLADLESPNFKEFQKYIDSVKNDYKDYSSNYNYKNKAVQLNKKFQIKNRKNIKYDANISNALNNVKIFINSLMISFQSDDNIISYSFNKIHIQKKEGCIKSKLNEANLSFRKDGQNCKNFKIINLEEETSINFDLNKNLACVKITQPKVNLDTEKLKNILKSLDYLSEQIDMEVILCKIDLQILNSILKLNNEFIFSISDILIKNYDDKKSDAIYFTINDFEVKNKNNEFITGQKKLDINLEIRSVVDYSLTVNFSYLNIFLSKTDINNLTKIFCTKENNLKNKEIKHFKPSSSSQKESHEFNVNLEANLPLICLCLCTEKRYKKCELIIAPLGGQAKFHIPTKYKNSNDIKKSVKIYLGRINLNYIDDNNNQFIIIKYKEKEDYIFNEEKSMISLEHNLLSQKNQIEISLSNEKNKTINAIIMNINKLGISLKLDIISQFLFFIKEIMPKSIFENKKILKNNKNIIKKRKSEIKFNLNFNEIELKFESLINNNFEEIYFNINKLNYVFTSRPKRKLPFGINEIKLDKLFLIIIYNKEINKIINIPNNCLIIKADIKENLSEIDINIDEIFIKLSYTDISIINDLISSNISFFNKYKNNLLNSEISEIKNEGKKECFLNKLLSLNINIKSFDLTLIDNYSYNYNPFLYLKLYNISSFLNEKKTFNSSLYISLSMYNYISSIWEPVIENSCLKSMIIQKKENNEISNIIKIEIFQILVNISDMLIGSSVLSFNNLKKVLEPNKTFNQSNENNISQSKINISLSALSNSSFRDNDIIPIKKQTSNKIINLTGRGLKVLFNNKKYICSSTNETELESPNKFDKFKNKLKIYYDNNTVIDIPFGNLGTNNYSMSNGQFFVWENIVSKDRLINIILYSQIIFKNKTNYTFQIKLMNNIIGYKFILLKSNSKSGIPLEFCNQDTSFALRIYEKYGDNNYFNENENIYNLSDIINLPNDENYQQTINFQNKYLLLKLQKKIDKVSTLLITTEYSIINCLPCDIFLEAKNKKGKIKKCSQLLIDFFSDSEIEIRLIIKTSTDYFYSEIIKLNMFLVNYKKNEIKNTILFRNKRGESFNLSYLLKNKDYHKSFIIYSEYILYNESGINFQFLSNILFNIGENIYLISNRSDLENINFEISNEILSSQYANLQEIIKASPFYQLRLNNGKDFLNFSIKKNLSYISIRNNPNFKENIISMIFHILPMCKITNLFRNKKLVIRDIKDKTKDIIIKPLDQASFNFFNINKNKLTVELGLINANENKCNNSCLFNSFYCGIYTFVSQKEFFNLEIKDSSSDGVLNIFVTETNLENAKIVVINKTKINFQIYQNNYEEFKQTIKEYDSQILKIYNQNHTVFNADINGKKFGLNFISFKEEFDIYPIDDKYILVKESNGIKMKITLYTKNEFEQLNKGQKILYANIEINNLYISLIGDNFNKNRKLRNYKRNEILLIYLQNLDTELNINNNNGIISHKKNMELKLDLAKIEIYNQFSKNGKYSCIFKNLNTPFIRLNLKSNLYSEDHLAKINSFIYNMNKLKLNIDPEFILEILNFADNVAYRLGKINFNVDKLFLRTNRNIRDIRIKANIEKYNKYQKLICYGSDFNFPSLNIDYEFTEINLEKLLRDKVGCTDLLVWLGFGLARHNQNIYLEKFTINQYFGDIPGLILKAQNNYKSQMTSVILNMGMHGLLGKIRQFFLKDRTDENSIDVQKSRIRYPRAFYGKYRYIKNYSDDDAKIIEKFMFIYRKDFKDLICNDIVQSKNYFFYFSGLSLYVFTKKYEVYFKIDYNKIDKVYNDKEFLIIKYKKDNDEEYPPSTINCGESHVSKKIIKILIKYIDNV